MRTMLITGATSGIGKALTLLAVEEGFHVVACGRNEETLASLAQTPEITARKFDVSDASETAAALAEQQWDIAVLNAGNCEYVDVNAFDPQLFRRVLEPNFFGVVNTVAALLPTARKGNKIVVVDSMSRLLPFTRAQAYGASKAAVHYFAKSLEIDLYDKGIKVQTVSPGFVDTPLTAKNDFKMPMKISAQEAAEEILYGINKNKQSVFFPTLFGVILRFLHILPTGLQRAISLKMRNER